MSYKGGEGFGKMTRNATLGGWGGIKIVKKVSRII
jgi:hypothetical protein